MALKKKSYKKKLVRRAVRKTYRKKRSMNMSPLSGKDLIVRPRYYTKCKTAIMGYIPAGTTPASGRGYMLVLGNSFFQPWSTGSTFSSLTFGGTYTGGSSNSLNPLGYGVLSPMYNSYRQHASVIKIKCSVANANDALELVCFPIAGNALSGLSLPLTVLNQQVGQDRCKRAFVNNQTSPKTVKNGSKSRLAMGLTKMEYDGGIPTAGVGSQPGTNSSFYWYIEYNLIGGALSVGNLYWEIELEQYIELTSPVNIIS